jgi:tRNA threonylcarbamoyladenosine biosynthesis protein TsaB
MMPIVNVPVHTPAGWLLAIDTSSDRIGVALTDGESTAELGWMAGRNQSAVLVGAIDSLLGRVGIRAGDLGAIGVVTGPGTFNGLRTGIGTAKGLALGAAVPIVGVDTLAATALAALVPGRSVVAVVGAGRGRLVSAVYAPADDGIAPRLVAPAVNGSLDDLVGLVLSLDGPVILAGEVSDAWLAPHAAALAAAGVVVPPAPVRGRRPGAVAALALDRWRRGERDDLAALDATYLHTAARPAAT